jgi:hypothetical protein
MSKGAVNGPIEVEPSIPIPQRNKGAKLKFQSSSDFCVSAAAFWIAPRISSRGKNDLIHLFINQLLGAPLHRLSLAN